MLDSAQQVGRMSISVSPEVSYKEMANQCEALVNGKRMKMSNLMSIQRPGNQYDGEIGKHQTDTSFQSVKLSLLHLTLLRKNAYVFWHLRIFHIRQAGHPFLEQHAPPAVNGQVRTSCATEFQHIPQSFRLPASSPYDNFLKAARC